MKTRNLMLVLFAMAMSVACKKEIAEPAKKEDIKIESARASTADHGDEEDDAEGDDTGGEDKPKPIGF